MSELDKEIDLILEMVWYKGVSDDITDKQVFRRMIINLCMDAAINVDWRGLFDDPMPGYQKGWNNAVNNFKEAIESLKEQGNE